MQNILNKSIEEIEKRLEEQIERISTPEGLTDYMRRANIKYTSDPGKKLIALLTRRAQKEKSDIIAQIEEIANTKDFSGEFVITVEWTKSKTWGSNPRAYTNAGFESSSIGGCGYDKLSTATAQALNSNLSILKLLYEKKNDNIMTDNHTLLGYGSGYGIRPSFEGGVGDNCHVSICDIIGLYMRKISSSKTSDVYMITKK